MNHLLRELAPVTDAAWEELEEEAEHGDGSGDAVARAAEPPSGDLGVGTLRNRGKDLP